MVTKSSTKTSVPDLPIMSKYFGTDITAQGKEMIGKWRKGEKPIGALVGLAGIGVLGWGLFKFVLPALFAAIGAWIAVVAPVLLTILLLMSWKGIYRIFRSISRAIHRSAIRWKPFDEIADQIQKQWDAFQSFLSNKAVIKKLRGNFEEMSKSESKDAEAAKAEFNDNKKKADRVKKEMDAMLAKDVNAKETDDYTDLETQLMNASSAATRANQTLEKSTEWAVKYAARSNIFAKLDRKLAIAAARMENLIKDFEKQVELWKKDAEGAASSRATTGILRKMFGKQMDPDLEFAIECVTGKIAEDYAVAAQNIEDLNRLTADFDFNSDDAYAKLDAIANKINADNYTMPDVDKISNVNHKLTKDEKGAAGALGNVFE